MPRTILCTSGTTIARGCPALAAASQAAHPWETELPDLSKEIEERLKHYDLSSLAAPTDLSAEINSLLLLECGPDDEVVLLSGDDAVGHVCAEHLARTIRRRFDIHEVRCKVKRIPQLQAHDPQRFKREGLPHLFNAVLEYVRDPQRRYAGGVILNPTGGYKGVVPFLAILGMLYGAKVVYGSRASHLLIELPPQPITHDAATLESAAEAIDWAQRQGVFQQGAFFGKIPGCTDPDLRERFAGLLESEPGGDSSLSPLAVALAEKHAVETGRVFLSPLATEKLRSMTGAPKALALGWLRRTGLKEWRDANPHRFHGTDLEVYGNERNPIRIAGISQGKDFYLCVFYFQEHNLYDRDLQKHQRANFTNLEQFVPLTEDCFGAESEVESWSDLLLQREELLQDKSSLEARVVELGQQLAAANQRTAEDQKKAKARQRELEQKIGELEAELEQAKALVAESPDAT